MLFTLVPTILIGSVVAHETYLEYDSWEDRPLGALEVIFEVENAQLPAMPTWPCDAADPRLDAGGLTVSMLHLPGIASPHSPSDWALLLHERLGFPVTVQEAGVIGSVDEAHQRAAEVPGRVFMVESDFYFRGPDLNEKIEGMACDNLAIVNVASQCPEGIAAHELGHVLGLHHSADGLMRARAAACPATLSSSETEELLARSTAGIVPAATVSVDAPSTTVTKEEENASVA